MDFKDIPSLTKKNKNKILKENNCIILFYADWCGHCVDFKKHYLKLFQKSLNNKNVKFYKVDCTNNDDEFIQDLCEKYKINGFPSILKTLGFKNGKYNYTKFEGKRFELKNNQKIASNDLMIFCNLKN